MTTKSSIKYGINKPPRLDPIDANVPDELKQQDRWLIWEWTRDTEKGKWDKPPLRVDGSSGSSTNSKAWATYQDAMRACAMRNYDGIGYAMGKDGCGLIGVDIDNCRNPDTGELTAFAQKIVDDMATYTEVSPSGEGVKMWLKGKFDEAQSAQWRSKDKAKDLEVYYKGRYFTVTGHVHGRPMPIANAGQAFVDFMNKHLCREDSREAKEVSKVLPVDAEKTLALAKDAISVIDPDIDYPDWIQIGMGLEHLDSSTFDIWNEWSSGGAKYPGESKLKAHWRSFPGVKGKVTVKTLFYHAIKAGYVMPKLSGAERLTPETTITDSKLADIIAQSINGRIVWVEKQGKLRHFDGQRLVESGASNRLNQLIREGAKGLLSGMDSATEEFAKHLSAKAVEYQNANPMRNVAALLKPQLAADPKDFDSNHDYLLVENGMLDLNRKVLMPHSHEFKATLMSGAVYNAEAKCPRWLQFMREITCDDMDLVDYLQRVCGYCISGRTNEQAIFLLHGDGSNGKGVFTNTFLKLLGDYGGPIGQELLMASPNQHPTQFANLYRKRCVVAQETDQDCRLNEAQVKMLTGGDLIQCRHMREDFWSFKPTHKIFLATNHVPIIRGTDHGIWRRLKLVPFSAKFDGRSIDTKLEEKLTTELPGILNWCNEGFRNYLFDGLYEPDAVKNALSQYKGEMDIVQQFFEECIEFGDQRDYIPNEKLYEVFKAFCAAQGAYGGRLPSSKKLHHDINKIEGVEAGKQNHERVKFKIKFNEATRNKYLLGAWRTK